MFSFKIEPANLLASVNSMFKRRIRNCQNCGEPNIDVLTNGNRKYCDHCRCVHKLEYNRQRSALIREYGNQGLANLCTLDNLTNHGKKCPLNASIDDLVQKGLDFNCGWKLAKDKVTGKPVRLLCKYIVIIESAETIRIHYDA